MQLLTPDTSSITLDTFTKDTVSTELINNVFKHSNDTNNKNSYFKSEDNRTQYIDPAPYITSLKHIQERLNQLIDECDRKRENLQNVAAEREQSHFLNVVGESSKGTDLKDEFNSLYSKVENLSLSKIDPLGEKLKRANTFKKNSSNIIFLMKSYNHFYQYNEPPIELLTDRGTSNSIETAQTLADLLILSSKLLDDQKLPNAFKANEVIVEFATTFENDQLRSFNTYYQSKNFARLQNVVKTLFAFNNGINIVQFFVNSHPIFTQIQDSVKQPVSETFWRSLSNPVQHINELDESSIELLKTARDTINSEIDSITTIFLDNSKKAFVTLVSKIIENIIEPRLKFLLSSAHAQSKLCYLRTLQLFHNCFSVIFLNNLKSSLLDRDIDLTLEFEKFSIKTFSTYISENSYFSLEKENLKSLIDALITPFETANRDALKDHKLTNKIEQFKLKDGQLMDENEITITSDEANNSIKEPSKSSFPSNTSSKYTLDLYLPDKRVIKDKMKNAKKYVPSSKSLKKVSGVSSFIKFNEKYSLFEKSKSSKLNTDVEAALIDSTPEVIVTSESKTVLSLQVTQNVYKLVLEALTRSIDLFPSQMSTYTVEIFNIMSYKIGPSYIALGLESLYYTYVEPHLNNRGVFSRGLNLNIDLRFLHQFYNIFAQVFLYSTVVKKSFYPLVTSENESQSISDTFNDFLRDVEIGINIIITDTADIIKDTINSILAKQPATDYAGYSDSDRTQTADTLSQYMERILRTVLNELRFDPVLKMRFVSKLSNHFLSALILHLSHLKVTMDGFTSLTHDLAQYILIFSNLKIDDSETNAYEDQTENSQWEKEQLDQIQSAYKILNELPGLYTCQPESLREFCKEGQLSHLKKEVIRNFISNREDFQEWFYSHV